MAKYLVEPGARVCGELGEYLADADGLLCVSESDGPAMSAAERLPGARRVGEDYGAEEAPRVTKRAVRSRADSEEQGDGN